MLCHRKSEPQTLNYEPRGTDQYTRCTQSSGRGWGQHVENLLASPAMTKHRSSISVLSPADQYWSQGLDTPLSIKASGDQGALRDTSVASMGQEA